MFQCLHKHDSYRGLWCYLRQVWFLFSFPQAHLHNEKGRWSESFLLSAGCHLHSLSAFA